MPLLHLWFCCCFNCPLFISIWMPLISEMYRHLIVCPQKRVLEELYIWMTAIHIGHDSVACPLWYIFLISIHILSLWKHICSCAFHHANVTLVLTCMILHFFFVPLKITLGHENSNKLRPHSELIFHVFSFIETFWPLWNPSSIKKKKSG